MWNLRRQLLRSSIKLSKRTSLTSETKKTIPRMADTPGTSSSAEEASDDDAPLVSQVNANDSQVMSDPERLAHDYEEEIDGWMDDAAEFELYTQTNSYAPSTMRELQRIWNKFETFLRSNPVLSEFLDDNGRAVVPLHKLPCVLFIRDMDLSANFAGESILTCKVMHCLFLIILLQIFEQNWDQVRAKRLRRAPWFVGLEATCMQVRHVNLLCFASNFCFIGPENYEDERIVVFVHVACAQVPAYDGFTATDEVQLTQFPLLMAEKSASLPTLQKKFMHLMAIRYHILCASNYDVHPMKRLPMPTYTKLRKILQRSSDIFDKMCTAIPK